MSVETAPLAETLDAWFARLDDASYRDQVEYLFERSVFYREKLRAARVETVDAAGGLADRP